MTQPSTTLIALDGAAYGLPDGRLLFSNLHEQFDSRPTGLVGRNGVGKTVLARVLAGQLAPTLGRCVRHGAVYYLAQQVAPAPDATVADLAGMRPELDALDRIAAGSVAEADFDLVDDRWDLPQLLRQQLDRNGLGRYDAATPATALSGGEAMRVALLGAMLSGADFLILDEPSNHLDAAGRQALIAQLQRWTGGLLVVSHDRQLLRAMARIVELSPSGLRSYGGNYDFYAACKAQERQAAQDQLDQRKHERQREEQAMRTERERQERRQARGARRAAPGRGRMRTRPKSCSAVKRSAAKARPASCASSRTRRVRSWHSRYARRRNTWTTMPKLCCTRCHGGRLPSAA